MTDNQFRYSVTGQVRERNDQYNKKKEQNEGWKDAKHVAHSKQAFLSQAPVK
jgi:hypothetical protein